MPKPLEWPPTRLNASGASFHTIALYPDDREHLELVMREHFGNDSSTWNASQVLRRCLRLEAERIHSAKAQKDPFA